VTIGDAAGDLFSQLHNAASNARAQAAAVITLDEYVEAVREHPTIAATAHSRVFAMMADPGFAAAGPDHDYQVPNFFRNDVFGIERPLADLGRYFEAAGNGHETRRRILLIWGPPGGAKSTLATMLKRGLERWSHTDAGAVYAIQGCPMHEEPLHLIPSASGSDSVDLRTKVTEYTAVAVEGDLCPHCRWRVEHEFDGDFSRVPIERIWLSEARRIGIGTFAPSDPKSMSMEQLTGGINFKALETYGSDDDPRVLDWAGEFMKANRGMLELVELFKNPREFLYGLLSLAQASSASSTRTWCFWRTPTRPSSAPSWVTSETRRCATA
jgi:serine protein kinase